jgi:hypothetical protein
MQVFGISFVFLKSLPISFGSHLVFVVGSMSRMPI